MIYYLLMKAAARHSAAIPSKGKNATTVSYTHLDVYKRQPHILVKNQKSCYNIKACACGEIGRRTRLRIWRFIHGGSSPFTRTKKKAKLRDLAKFFIYNHLYEKEL